MSVKKEKSGFETRWLAAAVVGTYWGAFEIVIGSFLHNLRVPLSGTILSFFAVLLLVAFHQIWREKGIFWRAGLVAAMMKSISPSAIILGPMIGILMEALLLEGFVRLLGRNLAGYAIGGAFAVMSALFHKIFSLLVMYGFDLVKLLTNIYAFAMQKLNIQEQLTNPWYALYLLTGIYIIAGMTGALLGYLAGKKAAGTVDEVDAVSWSDRESVIEDNTEQHYSLVLLGFHIGMLIFLLWLVNNQSLLIATAIVGLYILMVMLRYRRTTRYLKKPFFWIQLILITLLASLFWNGLQTGNVFSRAGLVIGIKMNLRAFLVMVAFSAVSVELRSPLVRAVLYRNGFSRLYIALGLSFSALPAITRSFSRPGEMLKHPLLIIPSILHHADRLLQSFRERIENKPPVIFVSGQVGTGKTTFLDELVRNLIEKDIHVCGILAPGIHEQGVRTGYQLKRVPGGETKPFASLHPVKGNISTGKFKFDPATLLWGEKWLHPQSCSGYDVVVLDEVGPLELKGQGWAKAIDRLMLLNNVVQIWAVRSSILEQVKTTWLIRPELIFITGQDDTGKAAEKIVRMIRNTG